MVLYLLHEAAVGLTIYEVKEIDETNAQVGQIQKSIKNFESFSGMVKLKAFQGFDAAQALECARELGSGNCTEFLQTFIESNVAKAKKKKGKIVLGFLDKSLAKDVSDKLGYECLVNNVTFELFRGLRFHFTKFLKQQEFGETDLIRAQVGLTHQFSRTRIQFDVNRQDKPIIQSLAVLEQLHKDINTFSMRVKEWYGYHFPELAKVVSDNEIFCRLVEFAGNKTNFTDDLKEEVAEITLDEDIAQMVIDASKSSMGQEISELDEVNIKQLASRVAKQFAFRKEIAGYLRDRMESVAPNLTALIGENVGAKLISHAGGLTNLVKYPASTVQILGAEKALFRALKTKGNTPKYGLLYHSSFIGRAGGKDKGKISRYVANKCSLASRLDQFLIQPTNRFGIKMKSQVEERLRFFASGGESEKNQDVMDTVLGELKAENLYVEDENDVVEQPKKKKNKKDKKKKKSVQIDDDEEEEEEKPKKKKKNKKKAIEELEEEVEEEEEVEVVVKKSKKKKAKKSL